MTALDRIPTEGVTCPRCGALGREDTQFAADMRVYALPQRRFLCTAGHSFYAGVPEGVLAHDPMPRLANVRTTKPKVCPQCEDRFLGTTRQRYCSTDCVVEKGRATTKARNERQRSKLSPEELRLLRAFPSVWARGADRKPFYRQELPRD